MYLLSIGACICKLSIIVLHAVDRFICRVGTEVTVSVLFSQDHKKCLLLYESIHKKCPILSSQEFARNVNYSYVFRTWRVKDYRYEHGKKQLLQFALKFVIFNLLKGTFLMKFKDGKSFSAYVRSNLHSGYITVM